MAASAPTHVRIRNYNVGFGDCFLMTFTYPRSRRSVLIDFGSTMKSETGPEGGMLEIAEKIKEDCGGKLQMVVATHRHADHISGFGKESGEVIASLEPDLVVQPWTEDPAIDPEAKAPAGGDGKGARAMAMRLSAMQAVAAAALKRAPALKASPAVPKAVREEVEFLGRTNLKNAAAVENLMTMGRKNVYASFGTQLRLGSLFPGVEVEVLGPPTLEQSPAISRQAHTDDEEFWHLAEAAFDGAGANGGAIFKGKPTAGSNYTQEARWVIPKIDRMRGEEVLSIVRTLDGVLNNTSLILLFGIGDVRLLFPGDAQIENWRYALRESDEAERIRERLGSARFYKVGHHGSLNATPKSLWNEFKHRGEEDAPERLETMVSTAAGKHGSEEAGTEVPRRTLIAELTAKSDLRNTQSLEDPEVFWNDTELALGD